MLSAWDRATLSTAAAAKHCGPGGNGLWQVEGGVTEVINPLVVRVRATVAQLGVRPPSPGDASSRRPIADSSGGLHCAHSACHLTPAHRRLCLTHTIRFILGPFLLRNEQQPKQPSAHALLSKCGHLCARPSVSCGHQCNAGAPHLCLGAELLGR